MINFDFKKNCYGCGLCKNICPKNAIEMKENEDGFLNPVIDASKCVNCGLCEKKCLYLNERKSHEINRNVDSLAVQIIDKETGEIKGNVLEIMRNTNLNLQEILYLPHMTIN